MLYFYLTVFLALYLVVFKCLDWWTTRSGILAGKAREANPVMIWLISKIGLDAALGLVIIPVTIGACTLSWNAHNIVIGGAIPIYQIGLLALLDAFYTYVIYNNYKIYKS